MTQTLDLAMELIRRRSVTPHDADCQNLLGERLTPIGFEVQSLVFGEVSNLWARRGTQPPLLVFAGHTDVVPPGLDADWTHPPFQPVLQDGYLYGRGAADMKGSLAAMVTACEQFVSQRPRHGGSIGFLITSDEEGPARDGTVKVIEYLQRHRQQIDWCLVGEPSSTQILGDTLKNGRRGSLHGHIRVHGVQGHVAYPERAVNPIHQFAPALAELGATAWDEGNAWFPATSFQVSNIHAGIGADNVIPPVLEARFNFRYSTAVTPAQLQSHVEMILARYQLDYSIDWIPGGDPYLTKDGQLLEGVVRAIRETTGIQPHVSTTGGTSDGRFIAPTGAEVVEFGPLNATIHRVDECVRVQDLTVLSQIYQRLLECMLPDAL